MKYLSLNTIANVLEENDVAYIICNDAKLFDIRIVFWTFFCP